MKPLKIIALISFLFSLNAFASSLVIYSVNALGSGCPHGAVAQIDPQSNLPYVIFEAFGLEPNEAAIERTECSLAISVKGYKGYSLGIVGSVQGYTQADFGSEVNIYKEVFTPATRNQIDTKKIVGPVNQDWILSAPVTADNITWLPCSEDGAILRANLSATRAGSAIVNIDKVVFRVAQVRKCK